MRLAAKGPWVVVGLNPSGTGVTNADMVSVEFSARVKPQGLMTSDVEGTGYGPSTAKKGTVASL